jgi:branched-chain amino acid transport system permease protein
MIFVLSTGIAVGCVYALVALGYSLIYRTTGVVNFSQGSYIVLGGLTTYALMHRAGLAYPLAALASIAVCAAVATLFWFGIVVPLWRRNTPAYVVLLSTVVVAALLGNLTQLLVVRDPQYLPAWLPGLHLSLGGTVIQGQYLIVVVSVLVLSLATTLVLRLTHLGRAMRACAASRETSRILGISPERVGGLAMVLTGVLGGLGGILIGPAQQISTDQGLTYGVLGFIAAVLGGFGNVPGSLAGGVALGVAQQLIIRYLSSNFETVMLFGLLLVLLTVRPYGLFGRTSYGEEHG